jgi:hypothetical protein
MQENPLHKKIIDLLNWFNSFGNSEKPISLGEVERFVAPDIQFYLNGQLIASGIHAYLERANALKAKCKSLKIKFPVKEIIIEGNKAAVYWEETLTFHDGTVTRLIDAAFLHFDKEGKILKFSDVFTGSDPLRNP